jgi:hypothetical protein
MRSIVSAALVVLGGTGGALAQEVGVEIDSGTPYYYEHTEPAPQPRFYRAEPLAEVVPVRPRSCGEFRYWDGARCVDARRFPPDVR